MKEALPAQISGIQSIELVEVIRKPLSLSDTELGEEESWHVDWIFDVIEEIIISEAQVTT